MKRITREKNFKKHYVKRIATDAKLAKQFNERVIQFTQGKRDYPLNDHALAGAKKGQRSFAVANDVRVIYIETAEEIIFLDVGTHNQVY